MQTPVSSTLASTDQPRSSKKMTIRLAIIMALAGLFFLGYGLTAMDTAVSILQGRIAVSLKLLAATVSHQFAWGSEAGYVDLKQILGQYYAHSYRMALHTAFGGLVISIGISQFIPALRRRHPVLHRRLGMVVATSMVLSTTGAILYLACSTLNSIYSGPTFFIFLVGLAFLALFAVSQAALALLSRDFRGHMTWMAIAFAAYMTAPLLRADWIVFGNVVPTTLQRINGSGGSFVVVQTLLLMLLWLTFVGDRDLPASINARQRACHWPRAVLRLLAILSTVTVVHEGVLAPLGLGLIPGQRDVATILSPVAMLWAVASASAACWSLNAWDAWISGKRPHMRFLFALALCGAGAILIGMRLPRQSLDGFIHAYFWIFLGSTQWVVLALALLVRPNSMGRNAWGLVSLFLLWLPGLVPVLIPALMHFGTTQYEAIIAGTTLAVGAMVTAAIVTSMGVAVRWRPGFPTTAHTASL